MRRAGYTNASMLSLTLELERDNDAPARARTMIRGLKPLLGAERTEDATLLVSELVTNAVKYGSGPVELHVEAGEDRRGRFTISDAGSGETPALRETGGKAPGGYGLHLVDRIADDWGVQHASMHVWFDLSY
jgi:anti-sigma regulatory factor (Ser/Thr protein kinase)